MKIAIPVLLISALFYVPALAQTAAIQTTNGPVLGWSDFEGDVSSATVGWAFEVEAQVVTLSALGVFDGDGDGLANSHQVGIWSSGGVLVSQTTIPSGTSSAFDGGYRYMPVTPVNLEPGETYFLGALFPPGGSDQIIALSTQSFASEITFLGSRLSQPKLVGTFEMPVLDPAVPQGVFGPNFKFTSVPEASVGGLLGVGGVLAGACLRRRAMIY